MNRRGTTRSGVGADRRPDRVLDGDWGRSTDLAATTSSDETGPHLPTAARHDAYRWHTVATLAEPGIDTGQWIGQYRVTGSGRHDSSPTARRRWTAAVSRPWSTSTRAR